MLPARKPAPSMDFAIPTINIVFLLLLFFVVSGSQSMQAERAVAPPVAEVTSPERLPRPLLAVRGDGALFLDGQATTLEALEATIRRVRTENLAAFARLNILAERSLPARDLLALMDRLRNASGVATTVVAVRAKTPQGTP